MRKVLLGIFLLVTVRTAVSQVTVFPADVFVAAVNGTAQFTCQSANGNVESVRWLENGTLLNSTDRSNVEELFLDLYRIGILKFSNLPPEYNNTRIGCSVVFGNKEVQASRNATLLLLQGLLPPVSQLQLMIEGLEVIVNWTAPFSLDIPFNHPDVTYCVEVKNFTSSATLDHQCGLTEPGFNFAIPSDSQCFIPIFTVTPVNPVGNGSMATVPFFLTNSPPAVTSLQRVASILTEGSIIYNYSITMSSPVCKGSVSFEELTSNQHRRSKKRLVVSENNTHIVSFTTEGLAVNSRYTIRIAASNIAGEDSSFESILSTHDVINTVLVERPSSMPNGPSSIEITTTYSDHSRATGVLFHFISKDRGFAESAVLAVGVNSSLDHTLNFNLAKGQYKVFVHDIEEGGTLYNGLNYPSVSSDLTIIQNNPGSFEVSPSLLEDCSLQTSANLIIAECGYPSNSIATGYQVMAQQSNTSMLDRSFLYANKTTNRQTTASVLVEETGLYQVTIFAIVGETGILGTNSEFRKEMVIDSESPPATTRITTTSANTADHTRATNKPGPINPDQSPAFSGLILGLAVGIPLLIVVVALIVVVVFMVMRFKKQDLNMTKFKLELDKKAETSHSHTTHDEPDPSLMNATPPVSTTQYQVTDTELPNSLPRRMPAGGNGGNIYALDSVTPNAPLFGNDDSEEMESDLAEQPQVLEPSGAGNETGPSLATPYSQTYSMESQPVSLEREPGIPDNTSSPRPTTLSGNAAMNTSDAMQSDRLLFVASKASFKMKPQGTDEVDSDHSSSTSTPTSPGILFKAPVHPMQEETNVDDMSEDGEDIANPSVSIATRPNVAERPVSTDHSQVYSTITAQTEAEQDRETGKSCDMVSGKIRIGPNRGRAFGGAHLPQTSVTRDSEVAPPKERDMTQPSGPPAFLEARSPAPSTRVPGDDATEMHQESAGNQPVYANEIQESTVTEDDKSEQV